MSKRVFSGCSAVFCLLHILLGVYTWILASNEILYDWRYNRIHTLFSDMLTTFVMGLLLIGCAVFAVLAIIKKNPKILFIFSAVSFANGVFYFIADRYVFRGYGNWIIEGPLSSFAEEFSHGSLSSTVIRDSLFGYSFIAVACVACAAAIMHLNNKSLLEKIAAFWFAVLSSISFVSVFSSLLGASMGTFTIFTLVGSGDVLTILLMLLLSAVSVLSIVPIAKQYKHTTKYIFFASLLLLAVYYITSRFLGGGVYRSSILNIFFIPLAWLVGTGDQASTVVHDLVYGISYLCPTLFSLCALSMRDKENSDA